MAGQFAKPRSSDTETGRRRQPALLPRRHHQRPGVHAPRSRHARPGADGIRLHAVGRHAEPAARLRHRRLRRPAPGASLEPRLRRAQPAGRPLPGPRLAHRRDAALHGRPAACRTAPQVRETDFYTSPRKPAAALRAGADPRRQHHRRQLRLLGALPLDRRPHPPAGWRACRVPARGEEPDRHEGRPEHGGGRAGAAHRDPEPGQRARAA